MSRSKLYVGNVPYATTDSDLEAAFSAYGEVSEVKIVTDRDSGRSRGFAFVTFAEASDAEAALALNGQDLGGRRLVVSVARESPGRSQRRGPGAPRRRPG